MPPIAIVTRNRHSVLDVTLRSLSASKLSVDHPLLIFDDGSDDPQTLKYLYEDQPIQLKSFWHRDIANWGNVFGYMPYKPVATGIAGKIRVIRLGTQSQGVVRASCAAFRQMVQKFGPERGILMVQDDVVFNDDWFERLQDAERKPVQGRRPVGLICGCWLNKPERSARRPMALVERGGITAQCYYVTPAGIAAVLPWACQSHNFDKGFDNKFCEAVRTQADVYRMVPAVCQHIGVSSLVRPYWKWTQWTRRGRIDYTASGPYPLAKDVRHFKDE